MQGNPQRRETKTPISCEHRKTHKQYYSMNHVQPRSYNKKGLVLLSWKISWKNWKHSNLICDTKIQEIP